MLLLINLLQARIFPGNSIGIRGLNINLQVYFIAVKELVFRGTNRRRTWLFLPKMHVF